MDNESGAIEALVSWSLEQCRRDGLHMLEDPGCVLESAGIKAPCHRGLESWTYYYRAKRSDLADALRHPAAWNPSSMDGDASL